MNELALRTLLNSLEASRSSLHGCLHIFTWFVVVGLAFDLFVIIKDFCDDWAEFRYGKIHPYENHLPKRPSVSLLILALLGTALIVIGVAGELYVDVRAGKIETQIREANDNLLGLIIQEAGDAATSAKTAREEALLLGPREKLLVGERRQKLVDAIQPYCGQKVVIHRSTFLGSINGVPSPGALATSTEQDGLVKSLVGVLKDAYWKPETPVPSGFTKGFGIHVSVLDLSPPTCKAARVLIGALRNVPLEVIDDSACSGSSAKRSSGTRTIVLIVEPK
jgi:hypothetical protein